MKYVAQSLNPRPDWPRGHAALLILSFNSQLSTFN